MLLEVLVAGWSKSFCRWGYCWLFGWPMKATGSFSTLMLNITSQIHHQINFLLMASLHTNIETSCCRLSIQTLKITDNHSIVTMRELTVLVGTCVESWPQAGPSQKVEEGNRLRCSLLPADPVFWICMALFGKTGLTAVCWLLYTINEWVLQIFWQNETKELYTIIHNYTQTTNKTSYICAMWVKSHVHYCHIWGYINKHIKTIKTCYVENKKYIFYIISMFNVVTHCVLLKKNVLKSSWDVLAILKDLFCALTVSLFFIICSKSSISKTFSSYVGTATFYSF